MDGKTSPNSARSARSGGGPRVLVLLQPGANSRSIMRDVIEGFEQSGAHTVVLELSTMWQAYERSRGHRQQLGVDMANIVAGIIAANRIDFTVAMWANACMTLPGRQRDGDARSFFDLINHPHLMFWLDAPHWAHDGGMRSLFATPACSSPKHRHVINNTATAREMTAVLGFGPTRAIPYGVSERSFRPGDDAAAEFDLVFGLGPGDPPPTPLMLEQLERDEPDVEAIRADQAERVRPLLAMLAGADAGLSALLDRALASQVADRHTPLLDRLEAIAAGDGACARGLAALSADPSRFIEATARVRSIEQWERAFTLAWLGRRFRCAAFGAMRLDQWPLECAQLGEQPYDRMCEAYARGRVGLNVMRWQDDAGSNIKPLEIAASGRPCLMRRRAGIEELFEPGREIALFDTPAEAGEGLSMLLRDGDAREAMQFAAYERTTREHLWRHRARDWTRFALSTTAEAIEPKPMAAAGSPA